MTIVRFDPPSLRKHYRATAPAAVLLEDVLYSTLEWSPGGFCVQGYRGSAVPGDRRAIRFMLDFHGFEIGFGATVEVSRVDAEQGTLAGRYIDLGLREQELLQHFLSGLVSGRIGAVGATIRQLEIPQSLPRHPGPVPPADGWARAREVAGRSLLYLVVGPILIALAALAIYRSFYRLEIQTAVVARPIESLVSVGTGPLGAVYVREGETVAAGQKLFTVEDEGAAREVEDARFDRDRARVELTAAEAAFRAGGQRLDVYRSIADRKQAVAAARVSQLAAELSAADKQLARVQAVVQSGVESEAALDQARVSDEKLKGALQEARAELEIADEGVRAAAGGSFYDGFRLVEDGPQLRSALDAARVRATLAEERVRTAEARAGLLTSRAPYSGSVVKIVKSAGATVGRGEEVLFLERLLEVPAVQALLSQDEATGVQVGSRVEVQVPALGTSFPGRVERVDRANILSNPLLTNPALRPAWSGSDRSAWMSVSLVDLAPRDRTSLRSGMPAVVLLDRQQMAGRWKQIIASVRGIGRR
ncbi:MAG TPA: HlyD family efflux transporter periplasmic adaptor subunit [Candidatus Eisenbacteria bacterium]|jgi:multidrug resistance efflux pump